MPFLFSIGIQGALEEVSTLLRAGEQLCAFLDDVYIVCQPDRVRFLFDRLGEALLRVADIRLHEWKARVWNRSQLQPANVEDLGPDVWQPKGITVFFGHPSGQRLRFGRRWPRAWKKSADCGTQSPRCQTSSALGNSCHRAPARVRTTASPHVASQPVCKVLERTMKAFGVWSKISWISTVAQSGLARNRWPVCPCAWVKWACGARQDALQLRTGLQVQTLCTSSVLAILVELSMTHTAHLEGCLADLLDASNQLDREGFSWRPSSHELRHGKRPPENLSREPGEWQHGWQCWASSVSDTFFRKTSILSRCTAARRAHLRSHSGRNSGVVLAHAPTTPDVAPFLFRVILLERFVLRSAEEKGNPHRGDGGTYLPRGWRPGAFQRFPPRHEPPGGSNRQATCWSSGARPPLLWRSTFGRGCHPPQCTDQGRRAAAPRS